MVDVAKSPLDDVETISESHDDGDCSESPEEEEPIPESHGDVVTATSEFPDYDVEEDLEEKDAKSARSQINKYDDDSYDCI